MPRGLVPGVHSNWQVRFEAGNRTLVGYRYAPDPVQGPTTTTLFRNAPVNRPEQRLLGVTSTTVLPLEDTANPPYLVINGGHWAYAGTGLGDGSEVPYLVGYETDRYVAGYGAPNGGAFGGGGWTLLADSPVMEGSRPDRHNASIYQAPSGAWVFAAGTMSWSWGLDRPGNRDQPAGYVSEGIRKLTRHILNVFSGTSPDPSRSGGQVPTPDKP